MEKNYLPGMLFLVLGIIALLISSANDIGFNLVIKGTHISYGWFLLVVGVLRLIFPPNAN